MLKSAKSGRFWFIFRRFPSRVMLNLQLALVKIPKIRFQTILLKICQRPFCILFLTYHTCVCGQRFFVYNNDTNLNFIAFCPVIRVKISQFNQFLCLLFETQFDPITFTFFLYFEPVHAWFNQGQQAQPCCFSLNVVSIRVGNNARVYKKRSTAEKYMLNLTISNSLCYSQFTVFVCVCVSVFLLTNNNYVTLF